MNDDIAWRIIQTAFRNSSELQALLNLLKESCNADEYQKYARAMATVIDTVNVELIDRVVSTHPQLGKRIEVDLEKLSRIV